MKWTIPYVGSSSSFVIAFLGVWRIARSRLHYLYNIPNNYLPPMFIAWVMANRLLKGLKLRSRGCSFGGGPLRSWPLPLSLP